ncbi:MAG: hypothetical protein FWC80_07650 [Firmicutes bacterium]|nr:hypothetical protein [Bacillota bacterium]
MGIVMYLLCGLSDFLVMDDEDGYKRMGIAVSFFGPILAVGILVGVLGDPRVAFIGVWVFLVIVAIILIIIERKFFRDTFCNEEIKKDFSWEQLSERLEYSNPRVKIQFSYKGKMYVLTKDRLGYEYKFISDKGEKIYYSSDALLKFIKIGNKKLSTIWKSVESSILPKSKRSKKAIQELVCGHNSRIEVVDKFLDAKRVPCEN